MTNLADYKEIIDQKIHNRVFLVENFPKNSNILLNPDFSGTIQQLYILRNWAKLSEIISEGDLWSILKLYEFKPTKLSFNNTDGKLIPDENFNDNLNLYKKYYFNSYWLNKNLTTEKNNNIFQHFNLYVLLFLIIFVILFLFLVIRNHFLETDNSEIQAINLLELLELSTIGQQWRN